MELIINPISRDDQSYTFLTRHPHPRFVRSDTLTLISTNANDIKQIHQKKKKNEREKAKTILFHLGENRLHYLLRRIELKILRVRTRGTICGTATNSSSYAQLSVYTHLVWIIVLNKWLLEMVQDVLWLWLMKAKKKKLGKKCFTGWTNNEFSWQSWHLLKGQVEKFDCGALLKSHQKTHFTSLVRRERYFLSLIDVRTIVISRHKSIVIVVVSHLN